VGLFDGTPLERPIVCEQCGLPMAECPCPEAVRADVRPESQRLKLRVEKRKRGKVVTVVSGFRCSAFQMGKILKQLKDECGAGGTLADDCVEIQGDHLARVRQRLVDWGYKV
jgi:translation initiation factor 1